MGEREELVGFKTDKKLFLKNSFHKRLKDRFDLRLDQIIKH